MARRFVATLTLGLLIAAGVAFGALTHRQTGSTTPVPVSTPATVATRTVVVRPVADDVRSAERNLFPAPETALQLAAKLALDPAQRQDLHVLQQKTDNELNALVRRIAVEERRLDFAFAQSNITAGRIDGITAQIAALQGRLRAVRLRSHLATHDILTPDQLLRYAELRGYQSAPPDLFDDLEPDTGRRDEPDR